MYVRTPQCSQEVQGTDLLSHPISPGYLCQTVTELNFSIQMPLIYGYKLKLYHGKKFASQTFTLQLVHFINNPIPLKKKKRQLYFKDRFFLKVQHLHWFQNKTTMLLTGLFLFLSLPCHLKDRKTSGSFSLELFQLVFLYLTNEKHKLIQYQFYVSFISIIT